MTKDAFEDRRRALEEEYFQKQSKELAQKLQSRLSQEKLGSATGVSDQQLLEKMAELGFGPETLALLPLAPLLYVAWADGQLSDAERKLLLEAAGHRGIAAGSEAHTRLLALLAKRPDGRFFETTFEMIRAMRAGDPGSVEDLSALCKGIAEASGGVLGLGKVSGEEKAALEEIARQLSSARQAAASEVLGKL
jgi:hypothetical protein